MLSFWVNAFADESTLATNEGINSATVAKDNSPGLYGGVDPVVFLYVML